MLSGEAARAKHAYQNTNSALRDPPFKNKLREPNADRVASIRTMRAILCVGWEHVEQLSKQMGAPGTKRLRIQWKLNRQSFKIMHDMERPGVGKCALDSAKTRLSLIPALFGLVHVRSKSYYYLALKLGMHCEPLPPIS
eukprot:2874859-Pyramimonas_sp.AAC.2